jgi:hypothetical protein
MMIDYLTIGFVILVLFTLYYFVKEYNKSKKLEGFAEDTDKPVSGVPCEATSSLCALSSSYPASSVDTNLNGLYGCNPRDSLSAADLLPKDAANSKFAQANPSGQGDVDGKNYLNAGWHVGLDTQGSSLRNANLQLRSEPPNPTTVVSPFLNTTITPDLNRRSLEIGGDF